MTVVCYVPVLGLNRVDLLYFLVS